jgi:IS4 transposase
LAHGAILASVRQRTARCSQESVIRRNLASYKRYLLWDIELFFKWIKQNLRIKQFYGTSENAVKSQIWIAVSVYVLVAIIRKRLKLEASLYTLMQVFSVTVFEKAPIKSVAFGTPNSYESIMDDNQLKLFSY